MNVHRELCGVQKSGMILALDYNLFIHCYYLKGGNAIKAESVLLCSKIAAIKTVELTELVNQALESHWNSRKR